MVARSQNAHPVRLIGDDDQGVLEALLAELAGGRDEALAVLFDRTVDRLHTLALRLIGDARDAEEVVCDVYQHVHQRCGDFDPARGSAMGWLTTLTWSRAVDRRRALGRRAQWVGVHPDATLDTYTSGEGEDDELAAFVDGHRLRSALAALRPVQRRLILLAFFDGCSHSEIAVLTGLAVGTVKSHVRRGMERLRMVLSAHEA